jgi:hypothetical protein
MFTVASAPPMQKREAHARDGGKLHRGRVGETV